MGEIFTEPGLVDRNKRKVDLSKIRGGVQERNSVGSSEMSQWLRVIAALPQDHVWAPKAKPGYS